MQAERRKADDDKAREAMTRMMLSKEHLSELKQREMIRLQVCALFRASQIPVKYLLKNWILLKELVLLEHR